ncbi:polysaccharide deacetylase [Micromonospora sicca]|uniref:Polysaccharide deacetylase n=1 Tax=Micromonospora sicca TaxID=2202420 RepID=A0A317DTU8_9ACTN|nr:polysaccharide deacetylase family protein [Micromonospora sp. 4G51]PWR17296.1 polysaccharide deacetylase [Micromonospora sp. 4G51]
MPGSTLRATGVVTLVAAALLGSAYALGRSLLPDQPGHGTGVTASVNSPRYGDQPPSPADSPEAPSASPTREDRRHSADGGEGPFGSLVSTGSSRVALTFDDGPDPLYTPEVLALLREYNVKATFCVVGENVESHPDLVQQIVAEGHTLCNHSWNHDIDLGTRPPDEIRADLLRTNEAIRAAVPGAPIAYYRQPGGAWTYRVASVCGELGMAPLHWAVDPADWTVPGAAKITATVLTQTAPGAIVLMHDAGGDRAGTVAALRYLLPELMSRFQLEALPTGTT